MEIVHDDPSREQTGEISFHDGFIQNKETYHANIMVELEDLSKYLY